VVTAFQDFRLTRHHSNVRYYTTIPVTNSGLSLHKTFMDTLGRTTLTLTARNIVDEVRDSELVVAYDYSATAGLRKPFAVAALVGCIFGAAYVVGSLDVSILASRFSKS
jgi:oligosaccharyltransferase complex subunit alpha (ribophorin I)